MVLSASKNMISLSPVFIGACCCADSDVLPQSHGNCAQAEGAEAKTYKNHIFEEASKVVGTLL